MDIIKMVLYVIATAVPLFFLSGCKDDEDGTTPTLPPTEVTMSATAEPGVYSAVITVNTQANTVLSNIGVLLADHPNVTVSDKKYQVGSTAVSEKVYILIEDLIPGKSYYVKPFAATDKETFYGEEFSLNLIKPTITSVSPTETGRKGRIKIEGTNFPSPIQGNMKVLLDGIEIPFDGLEARVPADFPIGKGKKLSVVIKGEYVIDAEPTISIGYFAPLRAIADWAWDYREIFFAKGKHHHLGNYGQKYDVITGYWTGFELDYKYSQFNSLVVNDRAFIGVGSSELFSELNLNDYTTGRKTPVETYSAIADMKGATFGIGDKGYFGMGAYVENSVRMGRKNIYSYDPSTDKWVIESEIPLSEPLLSPAYFSIGDEAFFCGGYIQTGTVGFNYNYTQQMWSYNVKSKVWTRYSDFPGITRNNNVGCSYKGKGYIVSGRDIWVFNPGDNSWSQFAESPLDGFRAFAITGPDGIYIGEGSSTPEVAGKFYLFIPE
jgi:hypothetical protein